MRRLAHPSVVQLLGVCCNRESLSQHSCRPAAVLPQPLAAARGGAGMPASACHKHLRVVLSGQV